MRKLILCLCIALSPNVLAQSSTLTNSNDPDWSDLYCNQPDTIRNGSIACIEPKCSPGQVKKSGKCISPPPIPNSITDNHTVPNSSTQNDATEKPTIIIPCGVPGAINECSPNRIKPTVKCLAPSFLQGDHCVSPSSAGSNNKSTDGSTKSSGNNAENCIILGNNPATNDGRHATQTITNTCNEVIGIIWCHSPSQLPGTLSTECGYNNRYYQGFSTMKPGEVKDNFCNYSAPTNIKGRP